MVFGFLTKVSTQWGKKSFQQNSARTIIYVEIKKKVNFDLYFIPYTKCNMRQVNDLNVKLEIISISEQNRSISLLIGASQIFLRHRKQ